MDATIVENRRLMGHAQAAEEEYIHQLERSSDEAIVENRMLMGHVQAPDEVPLLPQFAPNHCLALFSLPGVDPPGLPDFGW